MGLPLVAELISAYASGARIRLPTAPSLTISSNAVCKILFIASGPGESGVLSVAIVRSTAVKSSSFLQPNHVRLYKCWLLSTSDYNYISVKRFDCIARMKTVMENVVIKKKSDRNVETSKYSKPLTSLFRISFSWKYIVQHDSLDSYKLFTNFYPLSYWKTNKTRLH